MGEPWRILQGDVRKVARTLEECSFDALLSDPPYGISFMGSGWDYDVPSPNTWAVLLRALKPGAGAFIFGGSRTFHRTTVAVEDAGFEIRDVVSYLYGSGFPKSLNVGASLDQRRGLKSSRPVVGYKDSGLDKRGTGASVSFDGAKGRAANGLIPVTKGASEEARLYEGFGTALKPAWEPAVLARRPLEGTIAENVLKWGCGALAIDACRIGEEERFNASAGASGMWASRGEGGENGRPPVGRWPANVICDEEAGASRFFYTAKASREERELGCATLKRGTKGIALRDGARSEGDAANCHPCVKPVDLCRYLARMLLPPKTERVRRILVPFSGSGSEMIGCLQAGWDEVVGIEMEPKYIEIATARITKGGVLSSLMRERDAKGDKTAIRAKFVHAKAAR